MYHWTLADCLAMTHLQILLYLERRKGRMREERIEQRRAQGLAPDLSDTWDVWDEAAEVQSLEELDAILGT